MLLKTGEPNLFSSPNMGDLDLAFKLIELTPKVLNNPPTKLGEFEYILGLSIYKLDG